MSKLTTNLMRAAVLTAVLGSFGFAGTSFAQDTTADQDSTSVGSSAPAAAPAMTSDKSTGHHDKQMNVETRIKTLHDKLKITSDQESDWSKVAQTMRDNEGEIHELIQARHANPDSMTAIDDLQSYSKITQAHADGVAKLLSAFEPVYNEMSDVQKKNADQVFGQFEGHHHDHHHGKTHAQ